MTSRDRPGGGESTDLAALHDQLFERRHIDNEPLLDPNLVARAEASGDRDRLIEALVLATVGNYNHRNFDEMERCAKRALDLFNSGPSTVRPRLIMAAATCRTAGADKPGTEARFYELAVEAAALGRQLNIPTLVELVNVGFAALALGDISLALHHLLDEEMPLAKSEDGVPEHPALADLLGSLLASQGYWELAIESFRQVLDYEHLPPTHELAALNTLALFGLLADDVDLVAWASAEAEAMAEVFGPDQAEIAMTRAAAALGRGELATAIDLVANLDVSAERATAASDRLWLLALAHASGGQMAEALDALQAWIALDRKPTHRLGFAQSMFDLLLPYLVESERWEDALALATSATDVLASSRIDPLVSLHLLEVAAKHVDFDSFTEMSNRQVGYIQAERRLDGMARSLRHDLRGPLQTLTLGASLLASRPITEAGARTALGAITQAARRLSLSIDNMAVLLEDPASSEHTSVGNCDPASLATAAVEESAICWNQEVDWTGSVSGTATQITTDERLASLGLRNLLLLPTLYADSRDAELSASTVQLTPDQIGVEFTLRHGPHVRSEPSRVDLALDPRLSQRYAKATGYPVGLRPIEVLRLIADSLEGSFTLDGEPEQSVAKFTVSDRT